MAEERRQRVCLMLDAGIMAALRRRAARTERTVSAEARTLLRDALDLDEGRPGRKPARGETAA